MVNTDRPEVLLWDLEIQGPEGPAVHSALAVQRLEAEVRFAALGRAGDWPYLYLVHDAETREITVLAEVDVAEARLPRDADARVPQGGVWLWISSPGRVQVVGARRPMSRDEIAELLGGHSPPPTGTTTRTS